MSPTVLIVMGVSGVGKTTVGERLAERLGWPFYDADDYHPPANVAKMSAGTALTDLDRKPWLDRLHALAAGLLDEGRSAVFACSALKSAYRDVLRGDLEGVRFVYLAASPVQIAARLSARTGHFMPPTLLESQFEVLEEPAGALRVDASRPADEVVDAIVTAWRDEARPGLNEKPGRAGTEG